MSFKTNAPVVHASQSFTRPSDTTGYTANTSTATGDLVANSTTAGSVAALSFTIPPIRPADAQTGGIIGYVRVEITSSVTATLRVHLFKTTAPTVSAGDNSAIAVSNYDSDKYLGYVDVNVAPGVSGAIGVNDTARIPYALTVTTAGAPQTIYGLVEARTAYTPTSAGTVKVTLGAYRDR